MEEEQQVMLIVLVNGDILVSDVRQVISELGEPDCRLIKPFVLHELTNSLSPWLNNYTLDEEIMISSDKILTLVEPKGYLLDQYMEKTK